MIDIDRLVDPISSIMKSFWTEPVNEDTALELYEAVATELYESGAFNDDKDDFHPIVRGVNLDCYVEGDKIKLWVQLSPDSPKKEFSL